MKRILAYPQNGAAAIELYCENTAIEWSMEATDMSAPSRRLSPYSLTFTLPFAQANNQFFEHWYEVNQASNTWSHERKTKVVVYDDNQEVFQGDMQLMSVNIFREVYECVIIGEAGSFYTAIRKMTWRYLFTSDEDTATILDHVVSMANVESSWDVTNDITAGAGSGTIVYTLADNAEYLNEEGYRFMTAFGLQALTSTGPYPPTPIIPQFCRPMIRVVWLWDYIFQKVGYTYESSFLASTALTKLYMTMGTERENLPLRALFRARVRLTTDINPLTSGTYVALPFTIETGDYADPDGIFTGGNFVAPTSGTFQVVLQVNWVCDTAPSIPSLHTQVRAVVGGTPFVASATSDVPTTSGSSVVMVYTFNLALSAGQSVTFQGRVNTILGIGTPWYIEADATFAEMGTYQTSTSVLDVIEAMPDMTCEEFIRAICAEFNLSMVASNDIANHLIVEPMQDYFASYGQVRDWTRKVDLDKQIQLRPTTEDQKKRITFEDAEGEDFKNQWWQNKFGWVKGRKRYDNANEFAVGESKVGGALAPHRLSGIPKGWTPAQENSVTPVLILRLWTKDRGEVKPSTTPPMLAFYHGPQDVGSSIMFTTGGTQLSEWPLFTHMSDAPAQDNSLNLRWGYDYPDYGNNPFVGFGGRYKYREFYSAYLESQFGSDSRLLECEMWLTAHDVNTLTFADKIWVKDAYYRVHSLHNYAVGDSRPCRVQLWKVLDTTSYFCTSYPIGWQANGQVVFADSETGDVVPATAICCLAADYYWDEDENVCLWNFNTQDGQGFSDQDPTTGINNYGNPGVPQVPNGNDTTDPITGVVGTGTSWALYGATSGASTTNLQTAFAQQTFYVPNDAVVMLEVQATAFQYAGTGGTIGDASSVLQQFLLTTTNGVYRVISNSVINHEGTARSLSLNLTGNGIGELQVRAVGANNQNLYWFAQVNVVGMVIPDAFAPPPNPAEDAAWNGAANVYIRFNGNGADMTFNG